MSLIAADSSYYLFLQIDIGHCQCFYYSCYYSQLAVLYIHNFYFLSIYYFMKNYLYPASLNFHQCFLHQASIMCLNGCLHQVSFQNIGFAFFKNSDFCNSNMKLNFSYHLDQYIQLFLSWINQQQGQIKDVHFIMKLNILISKSYYRFLSTFLLILYYCHYYCSSDFAPIFPTLAQIQVTLFHPAPVTLNRIFLRLGLHLYNLHCFYFYQTELFLISIEQFELNFQNKQRGFEQHHFHLEASFHTSVPSQKEYLLPIIQMQYPREMELYYLLIY